MINITLTQAARFIFHGFFFELVLILSLKSSAALDLAQPLQTLNKPVDPRETPSEWPQFIGHPRMPEGGLRSDRRTVTNPNLTVSAPSDDVSSKMLGGSGSSSGTPLPSQGPSSRRGSPHSFLESLSNNTRSVPATPLGLTSNASHLLKTAGTPRTPDMVTYNGRISTPNSQLVHESSMGGNELQASLSRVSSASYDNNNFVYNSAQPGRDDVRAHSQSSSKVLIS